MPLLTIHPTEPTPRDSVALLKSLSALLAKELGKPEAYMMTSLVPQTSMTFAGTAEPTCHAQLKSIGNFTPELTARLTPLLCRALSEGLHVPSSRIYIEFANPPAHLWGHDGETFG
jgi:phenylpyruvate tautomerase PptA (4-oxalocrotonate tautomerase family)